MKKILFISLLFIFNSLQQSYAQVKNKRPLLQFTGVVIENESLTPIPYVDVIVKSSNRGTISDFYGFFSFVAQEGDTIIFSSIGYKREEFILPTNSKEREFSLIQALPKDTLELKEVVIKNWPTKEQFNQAFINLNLNNDLNSISSMNLQKLNENAKYTQIDNDNLMSYRQVQRQQYSQIYASSKGTNNLLNPVAWAEFIKSWKNQNSKK